jgi:uncharacterized protein (TIGR00290 family)
MNDWRYDIAMPKKTKAWLASSSGKDSIWALKIARASGEIEVTGIMTTITEGYRLVSMHGVRESLLAAQAEALGLPLHKVLIPKACANYTYEEKMHRAMLEAKSCGVEKIIFGDLFLEDVRAYREEKLLPAGITPLFPLWKKDTNKLAHEMIDGGLKAKVVCLDPKKMPPKLAGASFDLDFLKSLPKGVDPCAENGEFHTFVFDAPGFRRPLDIRVGKTVLRSGFLFTDLRMKD